MGPEDVPTLRQILDDYAISDMLEPEAYKSLLAELENREIILRHDAVIYATNKALDKIISEV